MWQLDIFLEGTLTDAVLMPGKLQFIYVLASIGMIINSCMWMESVALLISDSSSLPVYHHLSI